MSYNIQNEPIIKGTLLSVSNSKARWDIFSSFVAFLQYLNFIPIFKIDMISFELVFLGKLRTDMYYHRMYIETPLCSLTLITIAII